MDQRSYPEQGYRSCLGIMRLSKLYTANRVESVSQRAILIGAFRYSSVHSILKKGLSFEERLGLLVDRESSERENRRMQSRLKQAALRQQACIQDIDHALPRGLDPALMQSLYSGQWIKEHLNILISGPTGIEKSFIACALGHQACLQGARVKYFRIPRLLPQLALARGDGSYLKMINQMARMDLIILDDCGLSVFNDQERRDIFEILDDRYNRGSTIITAQLPVEKWHQIIGDPRPSGAQCL